MDEEIMLQLINNHWAYIENVLRLTMPDERVEYSKEELIALVAFHYKTAGQHFWKHAFEHMETKNNV